MSSRINVGKVCPIPKGNWTSTTTYEKLNMVNNGGVLYIAKDSVEANTAIDNTNKWMQATGKTLVGNVETVSYTTNASVTTTTSVDGNTILNFRLPRGMSGNDDLDDTAGSGDTDKVWSADKTFSEIDNIKNDKAPVITEIASGSIATFSDGADSLPVSALTVGIEPVQDLHGYDNPWPAGGGKNKLPLPVAETKNGVTLSYNSDGSVKITGTASANTYFDFFAGNFDSTAFVGYKFSGLDSAVTGITFRISDSDRVAIQSGNTMITISDNGSGLYFAIRVETGTALPSGGVTIYPMLVAPSESSTSFTPYSNICPITGFTGMNVQRTGKNLCEGSTNDLISINSTEASVISEKGTCLVCHLVKGQTYAFSNPDNNRRVVTFWDSLPTVGSTTPYFQSLTVNTFTAIKSGLALIYIYNSAVDTSNAQVELGSTATPYAPYTGTTYPISWQSEAGTVYGGSLDVSSGKLVIDRKKFELADDETWTKLNSNTNIYYLSDITDMWLDYSVILGSRYYGSGLCNTHKFVYATPNVNSYEFSIWYDTSYSGHRIMFSAPQINTVNDFITFLQQNNIYIIYKLATPITYQLTPTEVSTLLGINNIWADCGDVNVSYCADTKLYIQKLTQPTEDDMTANDNIAANKFFMIGNTLYYSTQAISTGTTIVPGSNCTQLSLADALNQLNA